MKTRAVALTVPAYVAADLVAEQSAAAAEALKVWAPAPSMPPAPGLGSS